MIYIIRSPRQQSIRRKYLTGMFAVSLLFSSPAHAATSYGLDTPAPVNDIPFAIQGAQVMDMSNSGFGPGANLRGLALSGFLRLGSVNGEGGTIQLDGNDGTTIYVENINGSFRLLNSPWSAQLFAVDQGGNTSTTGNLGVNGSINAQSTISAAGTVSGTGNDSTWAGSFSGTQYGVYGSGASWAGYFNGSIYTSNQVNVGGSLFIDYNQIWTNGTLYLNYNSPNGWVQMGSGGNWVALNIPNGEICLNGSCVTSMPPVFGGGFTTWAYGCAGNNPFTGGCSCPGWAPNQHGGMLSGLEDVRGDYDSMTFCTSN
jgi:hypothetical protein